MLKVNSYDEYNTLTKNFRKQHAPITSNLFLLPQELKETIQDGRMSYCTADESLLIFVDEGTYYHMYYFMSPSGSLNFEKPDKPVLVEVIYNVNRDDDAVEAIRKKCLEAGGQFKKRSLHLEMKEEQRAAAAEKEADAVLKRLDDAGITITYATKEELPRIQELWDSYLDPFDFKYMPLPVLETMVDKHELMAVRDESGKVLAAECIQISGSRSLAYHLAADTAARGKGIGKALMYKWFQLTKESGAKICNAWIAEDNEVSMKCHLKAGSLTGKASEQYVFM